MGSLPSGRSRCLGRVICALHVPSPGLTGTLDCYVQSLEW